MSTRQDDDTPRTEKLSWFGTDRTTVLYRGMWIACALLAIADFAFAHHPAFRFEGFPVFYGLFGFIVCFLLVLAAREFRRIVKRDEDYYDR
ncbi:MAG: hypothetical protein R3229_09665 [Alphaproteobacteria bacterium]|nr:hypothetical protein [Alphaproteobacteria bacterium]